MFIHDRNGCAVLKFNLFEPFQNIVASVSTRKGGSSAGPFATMNAGFTVGDNPDDVERNRRIYCGCVGARSETLATVKQIHGTVVHVAQKPGYYGDGDGFITGEPGIFMAVQIADCIPVFLYEPHANVMALLHAGWRGVEAGIIRGALQLMKDRFSVNPGDIFAALGPHIRSCCYTAGNEVAGHFPREAVESRGNGGLYLNLAYCAVKQIKDAGVPDASIEHEGFCTSCEKDLFFSHRRDRGRTGRMMALMGRL